MQKGGYEQIELGSSGSRRKTWGLEVILAIHDGVISFWPTHGGYLPTICPY